MATGYYGLDHPNPHGTVNGDGRYWGRQHRRDEFSGGIAVHTAEVPPDYVLPDRGAEATGDYFTGSTRPASYHTIADSDSIVRFLPFDHEAYHDATGGNRWSVGVSMGTQAHTWGTNLEHDELVLRNAARAIAEAARYWASLAPGRDPLAVARWITPAQYRAKEPGLVEHGQLDPSRRSDPWTTHRLRPDLRDRLVAYVRAELTGQPAPEPEPTPDPEELTVADIAAILDRLDQQDRAIAELRSSVGGWLQGERAFNGSGLFRVDGRDAVHVLRFDTAGPYLARLSPELLAILMAGADVDPIVTVVSDPAQVAALSALPGFDER